MGEGASPGSTGGFGFISQLPRGLTDVCKARMRHDRSVRCVTDVLGLEGEEDNNWEEDGGRVAGGLETGAPFMAGTTSALSCTLSSSDLCIIIGEEWETDNHLLIAGAVEDLSSTPHGCIMDPQTVNSLTRGVGTRSVSSDKHQRA